jgi:formylmethanofuran dehydrogenase subunit B
MTLSDAEFEAAIARAARLLSASCAPVIGGLGADVAGIVAAFRLAGKIRAVVDHAGAEAMLRDQAVLQDAGLMLVSPGEARQRADTVLLVGDQSLETWPGLPAFLASDATSTSSGRRVVAMTGRAPEWPDAEVTLLRTTEAELPGLLAALRARVNARPLSPNFDRAFEIEEASALLKAASFGVALWSPESLETLAIEMLMGLIKDLNITTRFGGLSVAADATANAAAMTSAWMTGLPLRVSFARGRPAHDPWQHDARRLVETGEADAVVWIAAFDEPPPEWLGGVPAVVLTDAAMLPVGPNAIMIPVGRPGRDHDGIVFDRTTGSLVEARTQAPVPTPTAATVLDRIADAVSPP